MYFVCSDKAAGSDAAYVEQVSPQVTRSPVEEPLKASEELSVGGLIEELGLAVARQATLVDQLKARYAGEGSNSAAKDEEIAQLKA